jgi:hypothetical protein
MQSPILSIHPGLAESTRLPSLVHQRQQVGLLEILTLLLAGAAAAAASVLLDYSLRIPGHAIIRCVFPMAMGLALAPRRMAGMVMAGGALGSTLAMGAVGLGGLGAGATTSLLLTGPLLDFALWRARRGWRLYLGFAAAGLLSNLTALLVRGATKFVGIGRGGGRSFSDWWMQASVTYVLCGLIAGLVSAAIWFRFASRDDGQRGSESES